MCSKLEMAIKAADETRADDRIENVARAFIKELREWFRLEKVLHIQGVKFDAQFVANANDYFDANMAMDAAFAASGLHTIDPIKGTMSDDMADLFNNAWNKAIDIAKVEHGSV